MEKVIWLKLRHIENTKEKIYWSLCSLIIFIITIIQRHDFYL